MRIKEHFPKLLLATRHQLDLGRQHLQLLVLLLDDLPKLHNLALRSFFLFGHLSDAALKLGLLLDGLPKFHDFALGGFFLLCQFPDKPLNLYFPFDTPPQLNELTSRSFSLLEESSDSALRHANPRCCHRLSDDDQLVRQNLRTRRQSLLHPAETPSRALHNTPRSFTSSTAIAEEHRPSTQLKRR